MTAHNYPEIRKLGEVVASGTTGNFKYRDSKYWRELAENARKLAEACEAEAAHDGIED